MILLIGPQEQTYLKFKSKCKTFHSRKCIWKYRLGNGGHFIPGGMSFGNKLWFAPIFSSILLACIHFLVMYKSTGFSRLQSMWSTCIWCGEMDEIPNRNQFVCFFLFYSLVYIPVSSDYGMLYTRKSVLVFRYSHRDLALYLSCFRVISGSSPE